MVARTCRIWQLAFANRQIPNALLLRGPRSWKDHTLVSHNKIFVLASYLEKLTCIRSLVIDHLEHLARESKSGLSYIYCDYKDPEQQSTENIVGAIIKQLLIQIPQIPDSVVSRCRDRMNAGKPLSLGDASELFSIICAQFSRVYICLDALDELQESNLRRILKWIQDGPSVHIFLTSRPHIQDVVLEYLESQHTVIVRANESDIRRFIEHEIGGPNDIAPRAMDERLKGDIFAKILGSAKGMSVKM